MPEIIYFVRDCARQHFEIADALAARYPDLAVTYRSAALMMSPDLDYLLSYHTDADGSSVERYTPKRKPRPHKEELAWLRSGRWFWEDDESVDAPIVETVLRFGYPHLRQVQNAS